jgi:E3 ubiquitin-protein ligase ZNF598
MSDTVPAAPTSPNNGQTPVGGRGRGGPRSGNPYHSDANQTGNNVRGRAEYGPRSRGRGGPRNNNFTPNSQSSISGGQPFDLQDNRGRIANQIDSGQISQGQVGQQVPKGQDQLGDEGEVCFICASTVEHLSIAPCNHQTCHICALRLRALYKKRDCAYCKVGSDNPKLSTQKLTGQDGSTLCDLHGRYCEEI